MVSMNDQPESSDELLRQYLNFLRDSQGLAEATCVLRRLCIEPFLGSLNRGDTLPKLSELAPSTIDDYVIAAGKPLTRASRKHLVSGLRSFLRFAHVKGWLQRSLVEAVPVILTRKLDRLPHTRWRGKTSRNCSQRRTAERWLESGITPFCAWSQATDCASARPFTCAFVTLTFDSN